MDAADLAGETEQEDRAGETEEEDPPEVFIKLQGSTLHNYHLLDHLSNSTEAADHMIVETLYLAALRLSKGQGLPPKSGKLGVELGFSIAANFQAVGLGDIDLAGVPVFPYSTALPSPDAKMDASPKVATATSPAAASSAAPEQVETAATSSSAASASSGVPARLTSRCRFPPLVQPQPKLQAPRTPLPLPSPKVQAPKPPPRPLPPRPPPPRVPKRFLSALEGDDGDDIMYVDVPRHPAAKKPRE